MKLIIDFSLALFLTYLFVSIVQTIFHRWFGHNNLIPAIFKGHAMGHHRDYRPNNLLGDTYIESEAYVIWYYAVPIAPVFALVIFLFPLGSVLGFTTSLIISIWWNIYMHRQYHVKNVYWEKFDWFLTKRQAHFLHHKNVNSNYAMVEYWLDDLMNTRNHSTTD